MSFLAQIPPPSGYALTNWLLCAAAAMAIARLSLGFWRDIKGSPANEQLKSSADNLSHRISSLENSMQLRPTAESVKVSVDQLGHRVKSLEEFRSTDGREASGQRRLLNERIETTRSELTQHVEDVRRELSNDIKEVARQVGETPAETVALLKNAGVIK